MIRYEDLVNYTKRRHINWNTNLFDVLEGFFEEYLQPPSPPSSLPPVQQELFPDTIGAIDELAHCFQPPADGEYAIEDLINLLST